VIRNKLVETPGVAEATVHYPSGHAVVRFDSGRVTQEALLAAVASAGYRATLAEER
jgi:copper chaperone CopZ